MGSIDRLALGSLICGGVALSLFCLLWILNIQEGRVALYLFVTWVGTTVGAVTLGVAALSRRSVRSGAVRGQTHARMGIGLGLLQVLLYGLAAGYAFSQMH